VNLPTSEIPVPAGSSRLPEGTPPSRPPPGGGPARGGDRPLLAPDLPGAAHPGDHRGAGV